MWKNRRHNERDGQSALFDYASTFFSTGLIQGIGVVTGVLTARILGPSGKGDLAVVFWLPALITLAGILGLPQAIAFEVSRNPEKNAGYTAAGFWLSLILGFIEAAVLYPLIPYIVGPDKLYLVGTIRWFLLYLPITFSSFTLLGIEQGHQAFGRFNLLRVMPSVFYIGGIIILWTIEKANVSTVVMSNLIAHLITGMIITASAGKRLIPHSYSSWIEGVKGLLRRGVTFHLPEMAGIILMKADLALLIRLAPAEEIGYYSVALAIALGQIGAATSLVRVNFPKVAAKGAEDSAEFLMKQFRLAQPVVLIVAVAVALASPLMIRYLFGPAFSPSLQPAYILIGAFALWGLNQVLDNGVRALGYGTPGAAANTLGLFILVGSGLVLVSKYGITGMAIACFLSQWTVLVVLVLFCRARLLVDWRSFWGVNRSTLFLYVDKLRSIPNFK